MALNIKDPMTERLAAELAELTQDTKTGAIRSALEERLERVVAAQAAAGRRQRLERFLVDEVWPQVPVEFRGHAPSKDEREEILGIGAEGA
ncbi:type II toxin-antitoxin system VapB family antitoxin [Jiangella asiatica]|uniref:Protein transcription factor n=1 Tax=Jiangella asiatica TaxID=2530372 RepID=A0A4R5D7G7_9ACTN|nr:type II toxin-antitoxin system VapB family antitoxin [Jiangella asiatica]TDE08597.1 protein transcription factor [Jiangella asiatica]